VLHNGVRKGTAAGINVQDAADVSGTCDGFLIELGADYTTPASRQPSRLLRPRSASFSIISLQTNAPSSSGISDTVNLMRKCSSGKDVAHLAQLGRK
jgi:hypothetical protein